MIKDKDKETAIVARLVMRSIIKISDQMVEYKIVKFQSTFENLLKPILFLHNAAVILLCLGIVLPDWWLHSKKHC